MAFSIGKQQDSGQAKCWHQKYGFLVLGQYIFHIVQDHLLRKLVTCFETISQYRPDKQSV